MQKLTDEELRLHDKMRGILQNFSLYDLQNRIISLVKDDDVYIGYSRCGLESKTPFYLTTRFNLQFTRPLCYLLTFNIADNMRRNERIPKELRPHYGTELYKCVEDFCRSEGIRYIRTTPSGEGIPFFRAMGFRMIGDSEAEKTI